MRTPSLQGTRAEAKNLTQAAIATPHDSVELVAFVEAVRYDGATFVMRVQQPPDTEDGILEERQVGEPFGGVHAALTQYLEDTVVEAVPATAFQTEAFWAALLAINDGTGPVRYVFINSEAVSCTQVLQHEKAEVFAQALTLVSMVRWQTVSGFAWKARIVTADRL